MKCSKCFKDYDDSFDYCPYCSEPKSTLGQQAQPNAWQPVYKPPSRLATFGWWKIAVIGVVVLLLITVAVVAVVVFSGSRGKEYTKKAKAVLATLDKLNSGLDVGYNITAYTDEVRNVVAAYESFDNWCSDKDKERESYKAISDAVTTYQDAHDEWQNEIESSYLEVDKTALQTKWSDASDSVSSAHTELDQGK